MSGSLKRIDPAQVNNLYLKEGLTRERLRQPFVFDEKKGSAMWRDGFSERLSKKMLKHVVDDDLDGQRAIIPGVPLPAERRKQVEVRDDDCQAKIDAIMAGERKVIAGRDRATVCEKRDGSPVIELGFTPADALVYITYDKNPWIDAKTHGVPITKIRIPEKPDTSTGKAS